MPSSKESDHEEASPPSVFPHSPPTTRHFTEDNSKRWSESSKVSTSDQQLSPCPNNNRDNIAVHDMEKGALQPSSLAISPEIDPVQFKEVHSAANTSIRRNDTSVFLCTVSVFLGAGLMVAGISVVHRFLLPRIYRCPDGAICHRNLDPRGNIIPRLSTLMQYWFQAGAFLAGLGLSKLISGNARLVLKNRNDATLLAVERSVSAANGDLKQAALHIPPAQELYHSVCRLLSWSDTVGHSIQHGISWVGILALSQIAVGLFISFVIGFSITDLQSTTVVHVPFSYHNRFTLPRADTRFVSTDQRIVGGVLDDWLVMPNTPHKRSLDFDGSLVVQDNRTILATNSQASGSHIKGSVFCGRQGWNASLLPLNSDYLADGHAALPPGEKAYNITNGDIWFVTYSNVGLAGGFFTRSQMSKSVTNRQYLWAANTNNLVPNPTSSPDGRIFFSACNHTILMDTLPDAQGSNVQTVAPSEPVIFTDTNDPYVAPCPSNDPLSCVSWSVDGVISAWWSINRIDHDLVPFSCPGGVLAGFDVVPDAADCALSGETWQVILSTALSALIFSAPLSGRSTQHLSVPTEAINQGRWWIQMVLPGAIILVYLACLASLWRLCKKQNIMTRFQELDLVEILCAKPKQYERDPNDIHNSTVMII